MKNDMFSYENLKKSYNHCNFEDPQINPYKLLCNIIFLHQHDNKLQDIYRSFFKVILLSKIHEKIILKTLLTNCKIVKNILHDSRFCYCLKSDNINGPYREEWWTSDSLLKCKGIYTLIKFIKQCSDVQALYFVANIFNISFYDHNVSQYNCFSYDSIVMLLGKPVIIYFFCNERGSRSFGLLEWHINDERIQLFSALYSDKKTKEMLWRLIIPPYKYMIYNRYKIEIFNLYTVCIHDDIADTVFSDKDTAIGTWAGDLSISKKLDWSFLEGRTVYLIFDKFNLNSIKVMHDVICKLNLIDCAFGLYPVSDKDYSNNYSGFSEEKKKSISSLTLNNRYIFTMRIDEFYDFAKINHGLCLNQVWKKDKSFPTTIRDLDNINIDTSFMVNPLFKEGAYVLITARQKVGKSLFAIDISYMLATGELMTDRLSAKKPYKVLYVDSEMPVNEFKERTISLKANYDKKDLIDYNFNFIIGKSLNFSLDLTTKKSREFIDDLIQDSKFIVFDNLDGLACGTSLNASKWEKVSSWLKFLTSRGITVLLVHHENNDGKPRGTGKITDDVDLSIALKRPEDCPSGRTIIEFKIIDARYLYGKQLDPFIIEYVTENNETKRTIRQFCADLKDNDKQIIASEKKSITSHQYLEREILDPVRHSEKLYVQPGMFIINRKTCVVGSAGKSKGTITKILNKLCESGLLIKTGKKPQNTRYVLRGNWGNYCKAYPLPDHGDEVLTEIPVHQALPSSDPSSIKDE